MVSKKLFENISKNSINTECTKISKKTQENLEAKLDSVVKKNTKEVKEYLNGFINKQEVLKMKIKLLINIKKIIQKFLITMTVYIK